MGHNLSPRQAEILRFIEQQLAETGRPPSLRDIARRLGCGAVATVQEHVRALVRKGYLEKEPGVARGLRLAYRSRSVDVPILGAVPAGRPIEAIESSLGSVAVPAGIPGELFALKVSGESMIEAGILDGDTVIVRKQPAADHGDIVVALVGGEATVKRLERKAGRIRLLPANPRFRPIEIPLGSEGAVAIQGKVVALFRHPMPALKFPEPSL